MVTIGSSINTQENKMGFSSLLDPSLLKAAKNIYHNYCQVRPNIQRNPMGVAIDRETHRGQLLFSQNPILLPWENFIPIDQLESEIH